MTRRLRLLLVEDSEDDALLLLRELQRGGFEVEHFRVDTREDMKQALDEQEWDLVVSDFMMPQFGGLHALALFKETGLDLPFIIVSGKVSEELAVTVMRAGAQDFISKSDMRRIVPAIDRELAEVVLRREHRAAEEALAVAQSRNSLLLESIEEGICGIDLEGRSMFVNPAACRMTGFTEAELLGQPLHALLHQATEEEESPFLKGTPETQRQWFYRKDGSTFPADFTSNPIKEGRQLIGRAIVFRDVSEQLQIDRMKYTFISIVSHELRTPLTSLFGSLRLMDSGSMGAVPERMQPLMGIALRNAERLIRITNDILDLERINSGIMTLEPKDCALDSLMQRACEMVDGMARELDVKLEPHPSAEQVWADADRVVQILTNLLSNAIKFSPPGARVSIEATRQEDLVLLRVSDDGPGIPEEVQPTLFKYFQHVDSTDAREHGGAGLGLAICRLLVEQHGGQIWVESAPGQGSTFYFTLPTKAAIAPSSSTQAL